MPNSARGLVVGSLIGSALATINVYVGLKTGWWDSGGILAVVVGSWALSRVPGSQLADTVLCETVAVAAAATPAALGLLGALPALQMMGRLPPWWLILPWALTLCAAGVAFAVVLREIVLERDKLPFPSGMAVAQVAIRLERQDGAGRGLWALLAGGVGAAVTWLRDGVPRLLPGTVDLPFSIRGIASGQFTLGLAVSPLLVGFGLMVDLRSGLGVLGGALLAWAVVAPALVDGGLVSSAGYDSLVAWLMWPGAAMLVAGGLTSLALSWKMVGRSLLALRDLGGVGRRTWLLGTVIVLGIVGLTHATFGATLPAAVAAVGLLAVGTVICARTVGEAGLGPFGPMGQITQLGMGGLGTGQPGSDVGIGQIVGGGVVQAAQTLESFRVGMLTNVPPARQLRAAALGILVGLAVSPPVYLMLESVNPLGSEGLPAPMAVPWRVISGVVSSGTAALPPGVAWAALAAAVAAVAMELAGRTRLRVAVPSALLVGLGFMVPATMALMIGLGAILRAVLRLAAPTHCDDEALGAVGSGAVAGESLAGIAAAVLATAGLIGR